MGTFTMPLKKAIKLSGGTTTQVNGRTIMVGGNIGLNHYPLFDANHRETLNGLIIDHYWNREIGMETISMFQMAMRRKMNEIMPYWNKMYASEQITYDPLSTVNLRTFSTGSATQESESSGESDATSLAIAKSRSVSSETPQTMLQGDADYATGAVDVNSDSDNVSTGTQTGVESASTESENETNTTGFQGAASDLIMRYRESLLNIDLQIVTQLEECFMLVWDNGDTYTKGNRHY